MNSFDFGPTSHTSQPCRGVAILGAVILALSGCSKTPADGQQKLNNNKVAIPSQAIEVTDPLKLPDGPVGSSILLAYANAVSLPMSTDEFAKGFDDTPLLGRSFKVTVPYDKYHSSLSYSYDPDHGSLRVSASLTSNFHDGAGRSTSVDYAILREDATYGNPQPMSNAFGVTRDVTPVAKTIVGLGSISGTYAGVFPKDRIAQTDLFLYKTLEKEIPIKPDAGREAVVGLKMDMEGVIVGNKKHAVICDKAETKATLDYRYQNTYDECFVLVKFTRIAFHSPKLGTFAEWTAPRDKPVKHGK